MGSHLSAIGFGPNGDELAGQVHRLLSVASLRGASSDERVRVYRYEDASTSATTVTIVDGAITCLTPGLANGGVIGGTCGVFFDDDCPYERPLGVDGDFAEMAIPFAVVIDDQAVSRPSFVPGEPARLEVSALAEEISVFADEQAYRASGTPMSVESMIPSGMFTPGAEDQSGHRVTPRVLVSGMVTSVSRREHELFGHPFVLLGVRSLGVEWTVAADVRDVGGIRADLPAPGAIVSGQFWLSGHAA